MSANTTYYVRCIVPREEWREISALTAQDARELAEQLGPTISTGEVLHWSEMEQRRNEEAERHSY